MPKVATARLHVCLRVLELIINMVGLGVLVGSALWLVDRINNGLWLNNDENLVYLVVASVLLAIIYNFYIQLLVNLRFVVKMKCVTCGLCVYDGLNFLCCEPCCKRVCLNGRKASCFKWLVALILSVVLFVLVEDKNHQFMDEY